MSNMPATYNTKQLAAIFQVCDRSIRLWAANGRLPKPLRIGKKILWPAEQIRRLLNQKAV